LPKLKQSSASIVIVIRDLYESIERGELQKWMMFIRVMTKGVAVATSIFLDEVK